MPPKKRVECDIMFAKECTGPDVTYKMLQGDAELLKWLPTMKGEEVVLKGSPADEETDGGGAVLCTKGGTYEVTILETTNTCLLCKRSDGAEPRVIQGSVSETQVLKRIPPDVKRKLTRMLAEGGIESEAASEPSSKRARHYTTEELVGSIRASRDEVVAALAASRAVEDADGCWKMVSEVQVEECLETLLRIGAMEFDLTGFHYGKAMAVLSEYHDGVVVLACLKAFTEQVPSTDGEGKDKGDAEQQHCLSSKQVCLLHARKLFAERDLWDFEKFKEAWVSACPSEVVPAAAMLDGVAVMHSAKGAASVQYFPSDALPLTAKERVAAMFRVMDKWPKRVMEIYLQPLVGPGLKLTQILSRHTREFPVEGVPTCVPF
eukprot:TRINITY_DN27155_c0_g1_i1.p1 TRINITY_DN27155_c0_g1~~TRINITY_DN27155_c0_g1_i1.p1  ORF type:complete len:377 (+),score=108.67 TRINITY_DN27155_c0_g1_i1:60-1190(+)